MGACFSKTNLPAETAAPWPELLPEIVDLVVRCLPDHEDRLSFGAVCHNWRLVARQRGLPPAMPCINLGNGAYQSLVNGKVRRFPKPKGYHAGASFGGWIFYYSKGPGRCFLRRPFSDATLEVLIRYHRSLDISRIATWSNKVVPGKHMDMKMVVCSPRLIIAIFRYSRRDSFPPVSYLTFFQPESHHQRQLAWSYIAKAHDHPHPVNDFTDIDFYDGKIFTLSCREQLFCHDIDGKLNTHHRQPIIEHGNEALPPTTEVTNCYLVVSSDKKKLLMARWNRRSTNANGHKAMDMRVFEADFDTGQWLEVKDLGGQALFLGRNSSMAFAADSTEHWGQRFRGGNHVFVLGTEWARSPGQPVSYKRNIPSYCVYDMVSGETSLVSLDGPRYKGSCASGWFFPTSENL